MPGKRDMMAQAAPDLHAADAMIYGDTRALVQAGFARTEVGWIYGRATLTPTSLTLPQDATVDEWEQIGQALGSVQGAIQWWIGDLVLSGEKRYGVKYDRAMELTGLSYKTLRNIVSVANRFEMSRRRDNLSFAHHAAVASLDPDMQDLWLNTAEQQALSVSKLKAAMRGAVVPVTKDLKSFRRSFTSVWKKLKTGQAPTREEVETLARWVEALKQEVGG